MTPLDNADPAGIVGGSRGGSFLVGGGFTNSCVGARGGREGVGGIWRTSCTDTTLGVDLADLSGTLPFSTCCVGVRFGGRGGSFVGPNTGAIFLPPSIEGVREAAVRAVPLESAEIEEMFEVVEAMDSIESRLLSDSVGLLGGRAGENCVESLRGGRRGGGVGFGGWAAFCPVRVMVGGGSTPSRLGPSGTLPMALFDGEVVVMLVV